jgi:hypothetical protein
MERIAKVINRIGYIVFAVCVLSSISYLTGTANHAATLGNHELPPITQASCTPPAGALFNPCADLDPSRVSDLSQDPVNLCLATNGVSTPSGRCVPAVVIWQHEVSSEIWDKLLASGYPWDATEGTPTDGALLIPLEILVLGGQTGEVILDVNLNAVL